MAKADAGREQALIGFRQSLRGFNPLRATWWLFVNVRWAIALLAFLAAVSLLGVLLPQIPASVRGDPLGEARWVEFQRDSFGPLTDWMHRVGLFDIFHARWFAVVLALLVASTAVYLLGRFPAIWWTITRPRKRVSDRYFQTAPQRMAFAGGADASALARALRRRWYAVETFVEGDVTYIFADRFRWAELGTIFTHGAVILFIVAAVVSRASGFSADLFIGEGASAPVFPAVARPDQMQVRLLDAVGSFSARGQPLDYRSELAIFQGGELVKRCMATVNSPCTYGGYRFHQAAYFGFGAELQVRDLATGNIIYREVLALADTMPGPHLVVRDASSGGVIFDGTLVLTDYVEGAYGRLLTLPGERVVWVGAQAQGDGWRLLLLEPPQVADPPPAEAADAQALRFSLGEGERARAGDLVFQFAGMAPTPASFEADFPLPLEVAAQGSGGTVLVQMSNVVYGSGDASAGTAVAVPPSDGPPTLVIVGLAPRPLSLEPGEKAVIDGYEYAFLGQRDFAGIEVKKDPSDTLIWLASGLLLAGLFVSFWVPRRRLWAKITSTRAYLASQGGHITSFQREARRLAAVTGMREMDSGEKGERKDD